MADVHGVVVNESALGAPPLSLPPTSDIGVIGTAPGANTDGKFGENGKIKYNHPFLITSRAEAKAADLGAEGTLPDALDGIFAQTRANVVFSIIEEVPTRIGVGPFSKTNKATPGTTIANFGFSKSGDTVTLVLNASDASDPNANAILGLDVGQIIAIAHDSGGTAIGRYEVQSETTTESSGTTTFTIIAREIQAIAPAIAADDVVNITFEAVDGEQSTRANAVGDADEGTGVFSLLNAESVTGVRPNLIMATGLGTGQLVGGNSNPIGVALETAAGRLNGIALIAGPNVNHEAAVTDFAGQYGSDRVYMIDPFVKVLRGLEIVDQDPTAHVAGLIVRNDNASRAGWAKSPSNKLIRGVLGTSRPIDFVQGDAASRANLLNQARVATIVNTGGGYRLWGNLTAATGEREPWKFINVRRIGDVLERTIQEQHQWAVDRNIVKTYFDEVTAGVNALIRTLVAQEALIAGECFPDADLNTAENIQNGKVYFNVRYTPVYPAQTVSFNVELDPTPLGNILG